MKIAPPSSPVVAAITPKTNEPVKTTVTAPTTSGASYHAPAAPPKTELEGASHGYVSPTAVESPFSSEEKVQVAKKIPCPALAAMFNAGMLKVEKDGTVKIPDLERALSQLGPDAATRAVLTRGADATDDVKGSFNLFKLNGSNLDHTGSSGIRQNGVHPERFELLMTFSKDGDRLTAKDLADAADHFAKEDPGFKGRITQLAEMSVVLKVFGRHGANGERYFTREDAKQLFVDGKIPSSWEPPAVPGKVRIHEVLGGAALGLFRQLINGQ